MTHSPTRAAQTRNTGQTPTAGKKVAAWSGPALVDPKSEKQSRQPRLPRGQDLKKKAPEVQLVPSPASKRPYYRSLSDAAKEFLSVVPKCIKEHVCVLCYPEREPALPGWKMLCASHEAAFEARRPPEHVQEIILEEKRRCGQDLLAIAPGATHLPELGDLLYRQLTEMLVGVADELLMIRAKGEERCPYCGEEIQRENEDGPLRGRRRKSHERCGGRLADVKRGKASLGADRAVKVKQRIKKLSQSS